jgi:hypothetical protein
MTSRINVTMVTYLGWRHQVTEVLTEQTVCQFDQPLVSVNPFSRQPRIPPSIENTWV